MNTYKITFSGFVIGVGIGEFSWSNFIVAENEEKAKDIFWNEFVSEHPIGCEIGLIKAHKINH